MLLVYLNIALGAAIVALNITEIVIIVRRRKQIKPYEQLLSSLAVADSLTGACLFSIKVYALARGNETDQGQASGILYCIVLTTVIISTVSLASITADRLLAIKYPFYHRTMVTKSRVWFCAILEWVFTWVLVTIPTLVGTLSSVLPQRMLYVYQKITSWFLIISGVAFCVCYVDLLRCLAKRPDFRKMTETKSNKPEANDSRQGVTISDEMKEDDEKEWEEKKSFHDSGEGCCEGKGTRDEDSDEGDAEYIGISDQHHLNNEGKTEKESESSSETPFEAIDSCMEGSVFDEGNRLECCEEIASSSSNNKRNTSGFRIKSLMKRVNNQEKTAGRRRCETTVSQNSTSFATTGTTDISRIGSQSAGVDREKKSAKQSSRHVKYTTRAKRERHQNRTVAITCILVVLVYLVCTTPYTFQIMLDGDALSGYTGLMLFLNSLFNPLIYFYKGYLENKIRRRDRQAKARNQALATRPRTSTKTK